MRRPARRTALYLGGAALAVIVLCCGGLTLVGALSGEPRPAGNTTTERAAAAGPATTPSSVGTTSPAAQVSTRIVTETAAIPYDTRTTTDPTLAKGTRKTRTKGVAGVKTLTYRVTYTDGVETSRTLLREEVTKPPVTKVVVVGTKPATPQCDPNYSGACVPIASDVDCAGGSGNGPAYVHGPVKVIGSDIYDLDRDGDGYGCD